MNLQIARDGQVSGLYRGYQAKAGETLSLQSTGGASGWMELANKPRLTVNSDHNLAVVFDFKGKMGGDEDVFTLVIDPRTGNASLSLAYSNDCGEGDMVQADTQDYTCHLGN